MVAFAWQVMVWLDDGRRAGDLWRLHGGVTKDPLIKLQQYIKWRK